MIAGTEDAILMVEAGGQEVSEEQMLEALAFGHEQCKRLARIQKELADKAGQAALGLRRPEPAPTPPSRRASGRWRPRRSSRRSPSTRSRRAPSALAAIFDEVWAAIGGDDDRRAKAREYFDKVEKAEVRRLIVEKGIRVDGRKVEEVRPIWSEVKYLPRAHGSALFTRGETQALVSATLGTKDDEQKIESFEGNGYRRFMLHYNFPSFSTGEVKRFGTPGRREVGHGALAQRAIEAVMPSREQFPYTIRVVSEVLESNGSSSMATVCGASMALMDAGVPIKSPVAGIAMGLMKEKDKVGILTDIMGTEDHYGDMDFKVAGTEQGITALQMDIKIGGVSIDIMRQALAQARTGAAPRPRQDGRDDQGVADRDEPLRAALRHHQDPAGEDPRDHRPRRQGHPRHPGEDRRQDRRGGRRQGHGVLVEQRRPPSRPSRSSRTSAARPSWTAPTSAR